MSTRKHAAAIASMLAVLFVAVPSAFGSASVTVDVGPAAGLFRGTATTQAVATSAGETQERSCEAGKTKSRVRVGASHPLGQAQRKGAVVACEQPPRPNMNITGLKDTEANAIAAVG